MSSHDITPELRISWDDNQSLRKPFYAAGAGWTPKTVIAAVRRRSDAMVSTASELEEWILAYRKLAPDERADWTPEKKVPK